MALKQKSSNRGDFIFKMQEDQLLMKLPGQLQGSGFRLDHLSRCEVYLLDWTSQVMVDDCGPCAGSVFIRDCTRCRLCVATRQLRTRDCSDLDISWRGAYPNASQQFAAAKLDPAHNQWDKVYDFNAREELQGQVQHWQLQRAPRALWVPPLSVSGHVLLPGTPENPVPGVETQGQEEVGTLPCLLFSPTHAAAAVLTEPSAAPPAHASKVSTGTAPYQETAEADSQAPAALSTGPTASTMKTAHGALSHSTNPQQAVELMSHVMQPQQATPSGSAADAADARETWRQQNKARLAKALEVEAAAKVQAKAAAETALKIKEQLRAARIAARHDENEVTASHHPDAGITHAAGWAGVCGLLGLQPQGDDKLLDTAKPTDLSSSPAGRSSSSSSKAWLAARHEDAGRMKEVLIGSLAATNPGSAT